MIASTSYTALPSSRLPIVSPARVRLGNRKVSAQASAPAETGACATKEHAAVEHNAEVADPAPQRVPPRLKMHHV